MTVWLRAASIVCALFATTAQGAWLSEVGVDLKYDDNLTQARSAPDIKGDTALAVSIAGGPRLQFGGFDSLTLRAEGVATAYRRYKGLNEISAGLTLAYQHKFGLGHFVPRLRLSASATRLDYDNALRDSWLYAAGLELSKRFSPRWTGHAAYRLEGRAADHDPERPDFTYEGYTVPSAEYDYSNLATDVFDQKSQSLSLRTEYAYGMRYVLSLGYTLRDGDVVSTNLDVPSSFGAARAIAADPVFGPEAVTYKVDAMSQGMNIGLSRLIGDYGSLSLRYEHWDTRAREDVNYHKNLVSVIYLYSFW